MSNPFPYDHDKRIQGPSGSYPGSGGGGGGGGEGGGCGSCLMVILMAVVIYFLAMKVLGH